jgi:hypothetical protein
MSNAAEILVIILSVFLGLFLLLAIVLTVLLIKVTKQIRSVTDTAQHAVDNLNNFAENAAKVTSPALLGKFVYDQFKKFRK